MAVKTIELARINFKELAAAIKVLNDSGELKEKINTVGTAKDKLVAAFIDGVQSIPDDKNGDWTGPEAAAAYYQKIVVPEEEAEVPPKEAKAGKAPKAPKAPKAKTGKIAKADKGPGVIASILAIITSKGPIDQDGILGELKSMFPDRDAVKMKKTIYAQIGGKAQPTRMEKEKGVTFVVSDKGLALKAGKKK